MSCFVAKECSTFECTIKGNKNEAVFYLSTVKNRVLIRNKVATDSSSFGFGSGLGWVWFRISQKIWLWFGSSFCDYLLVWFCFLSTEPENYFSKILRHFSEIFFFKFLKKI